MQDKTKADRYTYDFRNRLVKAEHSANYDQQTPTWTTTVDYLVDGLNRRVKKDLPGEGIDVIFLYDGWRSIEERELDGETWEARGQWRPQAAERGLGGKRRSPGGDRAGTR